MHKVINQPQLLCFSPHKIVSKAFSKSMNPIDRLAWHGIRVRASGQCLLEQRSTAAALVGSESYPVGKQHLAESSSKTTKQANFPRFSLLTTSGAHCTLSFLRAFIKTAGRRNDLLIIYLQSDWKWPKS